MYNRNAKSRFSVENKKLLIEKVASKNEENNRRDPAIGIEIRVHIPSLSGLLVRVYYYETLEREVINEISLTRDSSPRTEPFFSLVRSNRYA